MAVLLQDSSEQGTKAARQRRVEMISKHGAISHGSTIGGEFSENSDLARV